MLHAFSTENIMLSHIIGVVLQFLFVYYNILVHITQNRLKIEICGKILLMLVGVGYTGTF